MTEAKRIATIWLDGCSGCHMSFLDMDERILDLVKVATVVYSPLVDAKEFPDGVDVTLVEGAVATDEDEAKIRKIRSRTKVLVSLGDCAVTGNVSSMRNPFSVKSVFERAYVDNADTSTIPSDRLPVLRDVVVPVHHVVDVDLTLPGCPPSADLIHWAVTELLAGRTPDVGSRARFGA
jgi:NAD-reducing hydrogenase small subunit